MMPWERKPVDEQRIRELLENLDAATGMPSFLIRRAPQAPVASPPAIAPNWAPPWAAKT